MATLNETEFNDLADAMLARIDAALDAATVDIDYEVMSGGVLTLEFEGGSKIIINRHTAAREIWVAAKSGGFHFRYDSDDGGRWLGTRDGLELMEALSRAISQQSGEQVALA